MKRTVSIAIAFILLVQTQGFATIVQSDVFENLSTGKKIVLIATAHEKVVARKNGKKIIYQDFYDDVFFTELKKVGEQALKKNKTFACIYECKEDYKEDFIQYRSVLERKDPDTTLDTLLANELKLSKKKYEVPSCIKLIGCDPRSSCFSELLDGFLMHLNGYLNKENSLNYVKNKAKKIIEAYQYNPTIAEINDQCNSNISKVTAWSKSMKIISPDVATVLEGIAVDMKSTKDLFLKFLLKNYTKKSLHEKVGEQYFFDLYFNVFQKIANEVPNNFANNMFGDSFKKIVFSFCEINDTRFADAFFLKKCFDCLDQDDCACIVSGHTHSVSIASFLPFLGFHKTMTGSCYKNISKPEQVFLNGVQFAQQLRGAVGELIE